MNVVEDSDEARIYLSLKVPIVYEYEGKYLCDMLRHTADDSHVRQVFKSFFLEQEFRL